MSQHKSFAQSIIELGNTNLYLSDIIEKKKESINQIKTAIKSPEASASNAVLPLRHPTPITVIS
jgi:hypothetical protein